MKKALCVFVAALVLAPVLAAAQPQEVPPIPTPTDVKPGSITSEDVDYPYPSKYLPLTLYGQDVRMAYMDVAPAGTPNGHTVMLFHGNNFAGFYFGNIIEALRKEGFRVIVPDQIGYGRSSKHRDINCDIANGADDLSAVSEFILRKRNCGPLLVYGISSGALRAAALDGVDVRLLVPGVTNLIAVSPLSRAGYRGQGPLITFMFFRFLMPPVVFAVVDFDGWIPALSRRQVPCGRPVRTTVLLPVGRLPSMNTASSRISLDCDSSSATTGTLPSGSSRLAQSI